MHVKAAPPIQHFSRDGMHAVLELYFELNQLKHLYRQGWIRVGVPALRAESVAEHILNVALLGLFVTESYLPQLDATRVVRLALIHDLAEARAGDITPHDGVDKSEKHRLEREAFISIFRRLPNADRYLALWEEYENGTSAEARLVRQLDRLEMALQATVYERAGLGDFTQFIASARKVMEEPLLRELLEGTETLREEK